MILKNHLHFNICYYLRFCKLTTETSQKVEEIFTKNLDIENNEAKLVAVENETYDGTGYEFLFLFFEISKIQYLISEFQRIGVLERYRDVTNVLINGDIEACSDYQKIYYGFPQELDNKTQKNTFAHLFDFFIEKNRTVDDVMDRINKLGIDNILEIDHKILKNYL